MTDGNHIPEEDLALYAMQALSPEEHAPIQAHLDNCAICRQSLAEVLGDLALVAASVETHALPAGARERFLSRIDEGAHSTAPQADPARAVSGVETTPRVEVPRETYHETYKEKRGLGFFSGFSWAVAVAALIFAAWLGNQDHQLRQALDAQHWQVTQLSAKADRAQQLMDVLTSNKAQRVTLTESKQPARPIGHATYLPGQGALLFAANNLRPLPGNKTYELWIIPVNGKAPVPAGLFRPDVNGTAQVILPPLPQDVQAKAFGVTIENAQGATTPTLPIILSGE